MEFEHGQSQIRVTNVESIVFERKFDVALRSSHAPYVIGKLLNKDDMSSDVLLMRAHLGKIRADPEQLLYNRNIYPVILARIMDFSTTGRKFGTEKILQIIDRCCRIQLGATMAKVEPRLKGNTSGYLDEVAFTLNSSKPLASLLYAYTVMTRVVDKAAKSDSKYISKTTSVKDKKLIEFGAVYDWRKMGIKFMWTRTSSLVIIGSEIYLVPRPYLLLIHNKICDLVSVYVLACSYPDRLYGRHVHDNLTAFINEFRRLAIRLGERFFTLSKVLEGLVIGEVLKRIEGDQNAAFLQSITDGLQEDIGFEYTGSILETALQGCSVSLMHEIGCLSKLMGHPFCDMEATARDMEEKTHEVRDINIEFVTMAVRQAKQDFVSAYVRKHKKWPAVTMNNPPHSLNKAYRRNVDPTMASHIAREGSVRLEDWDSVEIKKVEEFNKLENFLPYIKDRTVSLIKSKVLGFYINQTISRKDINWTETRALLAYLLLPYEKTEHLSYLELYSQSEWEAMSQLLVIRLVPKEKEHKVKARCFGCKPIPERARTIVLGENASSFLHKYSDSEAMTLSELTLAKKLYAFRNMGKAYDRYQQVIICLDASGWNSRLRSAAVNPIVGPVLDGVYGTSYYAQAHDTYHHMFVYLPDVDRVVYWEGQAGGVEGLDQYVWVYAYINHLKAALGTLGYPFRLMVKGDDARVVILIPPQHLQERTLDEVRLDLVGRITELAALFGHQMKLEDSYGSSIYCAFSKNAFIDNTEMPQSFRKCQKAYGANNAFMNTLDDYIASAFSNCHSTSKVSPSPIACYVLALWWSTVALTKDAKYSKLKECEITALLLLPNLLGGFPVIYLHNFYQRAESDLLSSFIAIYRYVQRSDSEVHEVLSNCWNQVCIDPIDNLEMLCLDPYALPLYKPPTASSVLRNTLREVIERRSRNQQIVELFEARRDNFHETMMTVLKSCNIYNPKIMNGIHSCSPEGLISELITKFETGKSVLDAIILQKTRREGLGTLRRAMNADAKAHEFRIKLVKGRLAGSENIFIGVTNCPAEMAHKLRCRMWRKPVEGITQPPVFHTVSIGDLDYFAHSHEANFTHFTAEWNPKPVGYQGQLFHQGDHQAFLGESTSKGLTSPDVKLTTHNIFAIKVVKLLELYRWTSITTPIEDDVYPLNVLVEEMIYKYTKRPIQEFLPFSSNRPYGRTIQHHVRANQFRPSIVPNTLQNIYTWVSVDMLAHHMVSRSKTHHKLNYHEIRCWIVSVLATSAWLGCGLTRPGTYWAVTTDCTYCMEEIVEHTITCRPRQLPNIDLVRSFTLARQAIQEILEEVELFDEEVFYSPTDESEGVTPERAATIICEYVCDEEWERSMVLLDSATGHLTSHKGAEILQMFSGVSTSSDVNLDDLRFIPIHIVVQALYPMILAELAQRFPNLSLSNVEMLITTLPSMMYPWEPLMIKLQAIGRMRELQLYVSRIVKERCRVVDNASLYASQLAIKLYKLWGTGHRVLLELGVCSSRQDKALTSCVKRRIDSLRRCHLIQWVKDFAREGYSREHKRYAFFTTLIALARYEMFYDDFLFDTDIHGEIVGTKCTSITLGQLDIEDVVFQILTEKPTLWKSLIGQYKNPKIDLDTEARGLLEYDDDDLVYLDEMDREVLTSFPKDVITIFKSDLLTCKKKIQVFEHQAFTDDGLGYEGASDQALPTIRPRGPGVWNIMPFEGTTCSDEIPDYLVEDIDELTFTKYESYNKPNSPWIHRPIGVGNISSSRMGHLLDILGIEDLGSKRFIASFADGYGGASQVLSAICQESQFIFVTTPTTSGELPFPVALLDNDNQNNFLTGAIDVGRYDLRIVSNLEFLEENFGFMIDICVCDAELVESKSDLNDYWTIWRNVTSYFLRNCKKDSILIIKVYTSRWRTVLQLLAYLVPNTSRCSVVRSLASAHDGEVFVVAQARGPEPVGYNYIATYPPERTIAGFRRYFASLIDQADDDYNTNFDLEPVPIFSPLVRMLCNKIPCYGWTQLETLLGSSLDHPYLRCRKKENRLEYGQRIKEYLSKQLEIYQSEMEKVLPGQHRVQGGHRRGELYETRTHVVVLLYRIFTILGFLHVFTEVSGHSYVGKEALWEYFQSQVDLYKNWIPGIEGARELQEAGHIKLHDRYSMFKAFMQGIRWGLSGSSWGYNAPP